MSEVIVTEPGLDVVTLTTPAGEASDLEIVTATSDLGTVEITAPAIGVGLDIASSTTVEIEVPGPAGPPGPPGPEVPDMADLTLIFENGLI